MGCPQCHSDEIGPDGVCLICGYKMIEEPVEPSAHEDEKADAVPDELPAHSGMIEIDYSEGAADTSEKSEVPEWRQQLSQRLHEIKQKREAASTTPRRPDHEATAPSVPQVSMQESLADLQAKLAQKAPVRKPRGPVTPPPLQKTLQPLEPSAEPQAPSPSPAPADPHEIRNLIDNAVSRQVSQVNLPAAAVLPSASTPMEAVESGDDKLILLSRTLSGLIDLIIVMICTGAFIFAADYFSGIVSVDDFSLMIFFFLFLLNYLIYSLFLLSASNQTIGMMITELRVVAMEEKRPSLGQIGCRCGAFFVSLFGLGIGLLLGLFDRKSRCFHDRISGTHVVRI